MKFLAIIVLCFLSAVRSSHHEFPPWFKFGAATAAHQVEGAWNVSDKSPSIWDTYERDHPEQFANSATGAVACDSYHQWRRDVEIASELGLHFYRFSISWTRLLPTGFPNHISKDATKYYSNLIDELIRNGIEPVVTLYHFDLPQSLQDLGGWTNPLITEWFGDYARVVYSLFGDRVKTWFTINEPLIYCTFSYGLGKHAPAIVSLGVGDYLCVKNSMLAHAKAWRIYDKEFKPKYHGKVSLTNQLFWFEPAEEGEEEAAELLHQYGAGLYSHPIYSKEGGWPKSIEKIIAKKSKMEGLRRSRLPAFTNEERDFVRGTFDFYGLNYYTSLLARKGKTNATTGVWPVTAAPELDIEMSVRPEWVPAHDWLHVNPVGMRKILSWIKRTYGDVEIFIAENGYFSYEGDMHDLDRVKYYKDHLKQVLHAIYDDGVNVTAYTAWTMIDNFEWTAGYSSHFGLYAVDFSDRDRRRTPRSSAYYYARVIHSHSLNITHSFTPYTSAGDNICLSTVLLVTWIFILIL